MRPARRAGAAAVVLVVGLVAACATHPTGPTPGRVPGLDGHGAVTGTGRFQLSPPGLRAVTVRYASAATDPATAQILVVMHGTERNASAYLESWLPLITGRNVIVVAPSFPDEGPFRGAAGYNLGGVVDRDGEPRPRAKWTFAYLGPLLADVRRRVGGHQQTFDLFGHSAGAQFVHRYLQFVPDAPVRTAVAANAGWYTMPDDSTDFPYGWGDLPDVRVDRRTALSRHLVVLLGDEDVETENLRQDRGANAQGRTRMARGAAFFDAGRTAAHKERVAFGWTMHVVGGVAHDQTEMAAAAAPFVLPPRAAAAP